MSAAQKTKLNTPWKNRVAFVHQIDTDAVFLLVHPCGELLLVSNTASGAARWDRACIRWIEERGVYWMCKYSVHDLKFELSGFTEAQLTELAVQTGIEFITRDKRRIETPRMLDTVMARSLLNWIDKHPRMANDNATVLVYQNLMEEAGLSPLPDEEYTGS
tara:strand:+ start:324 stop:806 length:483 start_codon:yes stop_codon:yes gene_type:complete